MPYGATPWVREGRFRNDDDKWIVIDSADWFAWLEQISSFCYSSQHPWMRLSARKEKRGANFYWYGYRKIDAKLHNVYLGKSERLTQERLEWACEQIEQQARALAVKSMRSSLVAPTTMCSTDALVGGDYSLETWLHSV